MLSSSYLGFACLDLDLRLTWTNAAFARAAGQPAEALIGQNAASLFPHPLTSTIFQQALTGKRISAQEVHLPEPLHPTWDWTLEPLRVPSGEITHLLLTQREKPPVRPVDPPALTGQVDHPRFFDAIQEACLWVDRDGIIQIVNRHVEKLFGYPASELLGQPVEVLIPTRSRDVHRLHRNAYLIQPETRLLGTQRCLMARHKEGYEIPIGITLSPLQLDLGEGILCVIRDSTLDQLSAASLQEKTALLELLQEITMAANAAEKVGKTLEYSLTHICRYIGWPVGHVILANRRGRLASTRIWYTGEAGAYMPLREVTNRMTWKAGQGLPGQVLLTGRPLWVKNLSADPHFIRSKAAQESGLNSIFLFPLLVGREVVGVFEFFSPRAEEPSPAFLKTILHIGVQLGRVIERKRAKDLLQKSEAQFRTVFDKAAIGIYLVDQEGKIVKANPAMARMLGYTDKELSQKLSAEITHPDDFPKSAAAYHALWEGSCDHDHLEKRFLHKDGRVIWGRVNISRFAKSPGDPQFAIVMVEDVSDRMLMEAELDEVHHKLADILEKERLRLARELHDGPVQDLYAALFRLQGLDLNPLGPQYDETIEAVKDTLHQVASALRSTCSDLRPPSLISFGLEKAIRTCSHQLQEENPSLQIALDLAHDGRLLPERTRLILFRIYQEMLENVVQHARASQVSTRFAIKEGSVELCVQDNGVGFAVPHRWVDLAREGRLGLLSVQERVEAAGGQMMIESSPGRGTLVVVRVPICSN